MQAKPYYMLKVKSEDQKDETKTENAQYEGYCNDLAEMICKELGITCEIRLVADGKYGEKTGDGTWNGMIGELTNRVRILAVSEKNLLNKAGCRIFIKMLLCALKTKTATTSVTFCYCQTQRRIFSDRCFHMLG